jgi:hypothetical protein
MTEVTFDEAKLVIGDQALMIWVLQRRIAVLEREVAAHQATTEQQTENERLGADR